MECRDCKCSLTPDEAARHLAWENEKDAFERTLYAAIETPLEDEAADLPDAVPTGVSALPAMPGDLTIPASWSLPVCDRCTFALNLDDFFGGWDLDVSSAISWAYEVGWPPCHQSDVMALSWALVRRHWRAVLGGGRRGADRTGAGVSARADTALRDPPPPAHRGRGHRCLRHG